MNSKNKACILDPNKVKSLSECRGCKWFLGNEKGFVCYQQSKAKYLSENKYAGRKNNEQNRT